MYPLRDEHLKLKDLAIHWSRDLPQHPSTNELLTDLVRAFWRGELTLQSYFPGNEAMLPVRMLEVIDAHERSRGADADILVGATEDDLPPQISDQEDGSKIVEVRPRLLLPPQRPWPEEIVDRSMEVMSYVRWADYPDDLKTHIKGCLVAKEDFAAYCDSAGYKRPAFWFNRRASPAQVSSNRARTEVRKWFLRQIRRPKQGPKAWYFEQAKEKFDGLSRRSFDEVWNEHAPTDWRQAGRFKSSPHARND